MSPHALPPLVYDPVFLPILFDYAATFIWALSGALFAARRGFVGIGIFIVAVASATGGGLIRDGLLLPFESPILLRNPVYLLVVGAAVLLVMLGGRYVDRFPLIGPAVHLFDALGAGTYAVVGANRAFAADLPLLGVITVGVINAMGGGLLRDILMRRVPDLFKPGLPLGMASCLGATLFAVLTSQLGIRQTDAAFVTIAIVSVLVLLMLRFHIKSRPLTAFRDYWEQ